MTNPPKGTINPAYSNSLSGKIANIRSKGDRSMRYTRHSKAILPLVFFWKLRMANNIKPRSARIIKSLVPGSASPIPKVSTKIKGKAIIMPCIRMNE